MADNNAAALDRALSLEKLRWEAEDSMRPIVARLESAVKALMAYTELLQEYEREAGAVRTDPRTDPPSPQVTSPGDSHDTG